METQILAPTEEAVALAPPRALMERVCPGPLTLLMPKKP